MRLAGFRYPAILLLLSLAGCTGAFDPYQRPGNWVATGAADETIAQQAADPADLITGKSAPGSNGVAAAAAVDLAIGGSAGDASGLHKPAVVVQASTGD